MGVAGQQPPDEAPAGREPFHDFRQQSLDYTGPDEETPAVAELTEIALGWFGPPDPAHAAHGQLWVAASLAVEEANLDGGLEGVPFLLVPRWSENVWGTGVTLVARMAYEDRVWAILGSVDGTATHLAEQIVAKARLPLVSPVATDESINLAGVPWMFSLVPGDHLWAPLLADALKKEIGGQPFALLTVTDHDSRLATDTLLEAMSARGLGPVMRLDLDPGTSLDTSHLERLDLTSLSALVLVAGPEDSALHLKALRADGYPRLVFASPQAARSRALRLAGEAAHGVRLPLLHDRPSSGERVAFEKRFRQATGTDPDWAAMFAYDATRLLIDAVRQAGPSRTGIREALLDLSGWRGITGTVEWDPTGQNMRPVTAMATVKDGQLVVE